MTSEYTEKLEQLQNTLAGKTEVLKELEVKELELAGRLRVVQLTKSAAQNQVRSSELAVQAHVRNSFPPAIWSPATPGVLELTFKKLYRINESDWPVKAQYIGEGCVTEGYTAEEAQRLTTLEGGLKEARRLLVGYIEGCEEEAQGYALDAKKARGLLAEATLADAEDEGADAG